MSQKCGQAHIGKLARRGTNRVGKTRAGPHGEIGVKPSPSAGPHKRQLIRPNQREAGCLTLTRKPSSSPGGLFPPNLSRDQDQPGTIAGANSRVDLPKCRGLPSAPDPDTSVC